MRHSMRSLAAALFVLIVCMDAAAEEAAMAAQQFGHRDAVWRADLSPDGNRIVYIAPDGGRGSRAIVADLANGAQKTAFAANGRPDRLAWCRFVSNERLLCQIRGELDAAGTIVPYSRLFAVDADGGNVRPLGQRSSGYDERARQFDADVVDWLSGADNNILLSRQYVPEAGKLNTRIVRTADGTGVDRVDVATLESHPVESPTKAADFYLSDGQGAIRIKGYTPDRGGTGMMSSRVLYSYRQGGAKQWLPFSTWDGATGMVPLRVEASSNSAYVLEKLDGRLALYRVLLDGSLNKQLVYRNDSVDVDNVITLGRNGNVIGVTFADEARREVYFDPEFAALAKSIRGALPDQPKVTFLSASADRSRLLIRADGARDAGQLMLFDRKRKSLDPLLSIRPELENVPLSVVKAVSYKASDGTLIPAYLTLPPGVTKATSLPSIVLPHGGPSARDEGDFDWLAQYLAHEGYAVIQPNYRGSAGYGDAWRKQNGFRGWKTSIADVVDAARWLSSSGIADSDRIAIVGWSYGGYAALQASVVEPEMFKAVVGIAPVTDLDLLVRNARDYTSYRNVLEEIGTGPHVKEGSPLQNVGRIQAPVLLFHGDTDLNVDVQQSRMLDAALRDAGKSSELVLYPGLEHQLDDSNSRTDMLTRISSFLGARLR